jgi:LAS superfamily LD-carboxypeptidase LdcB
VISTEHILGKNPNLLVKCQQDFLLLPEVCNAFTNMQLAAMKDKVDLQIVSSYRSFERQLVIWNAKWNGQRPILDINERPLDIRFLSEQDKLFAILTWSALPGASRHHWGTDLDVYDKTSVKQSGAGFELVNKEYRDGGPCHKLAVWLAQYAGDFGFTQPYLNYTGGIAMEPWHISYIETASKIEAQLNPKHLALELQNQAVSGANTITQHLDEIFKRYVLNQGHQ